MRDFEDIHEFLGQQIYKGDMTPAEEKLRAIQDWVTLEDVKGIRSFLGFTNYYIWFIQNFATIAEPLTSLMRKDLKWQLGPYQ